MVQLCLKVCRSAFPTVLLGIFAFAALAHAQTANLTLGSGAGAPGSSVALNLVLAAGGTQPTALQWTLQYSPTDISGVTASIGATATAAGKSLTCTNASGSAICVIFGLNQSIIGDGTVAQFTFTIAPGTASPSTAIQVAQVVLSDSTGSSIAAAPTGGTITLIQPQAMVSGLSCSPASLSPKGTATCLVTLNQPAPASGVTIALSSNSTSVAVPASVAVIAGASTASFTATAGSFTIDSSAQITASLNGSLASASLTLTAPVLVSSVTCSPATLNPGGTSTCLATLNKPGPASGASIALSSNSAIVSVLASVTAASGATSASFTASSGSFTSDSSAQITASLDGSTASTSLTLASLSQVSAVSCTPASLKPAGTASCLVTLSKPAPAGGAIIALGSSSAHVSVPASVTSIAGATTASFTATAGSFTTSGSATITASLNGQSQAFTVTLAATAQVQISSITCSPTTLNGGDSSTCTVTLSSASSSYVSITLSSSTANVTVPSSVGIIPGRTSVQFTAASAQVDVDNNAVVTAAFNGTSQTIALTVIGVRPTVLTCSPLSVSAGGSATCTVQLNRAPQGKSISLRLASSSASLQVPQSLSTRNQQTQYSFTARAAKFASPGTVQLSATYLTSVVSANVAILAPAAPALAAPTKMTTIVGTAVSLTAQAIDLTGLNVHLSAGNLPAGATFSVGNEPSTSAATPGVSGVFQWIPAADQVGTYTVKLGAQSTAGTTSQNVVIEVASQVPHIDAVVNAASLSTQQVCSPGSVAIIQGTALQIPSTSNEDPTDQTTVSVNGVPAEVLNASATQIAFRCPEYSPSPKLTLQISNRFGVSNAAPVVVQSAAPGIFTLDGSGTGQGVVYVNRTSNLAALPDPTFTSQSAAAGDTLTLLVTGLPDEFATPSAARVTIGQIPAEVLALAGVPQLPGYQMLTVRVPPDAPVGDSIPVQVFSQAPSTQSNTVTIAIEQADQ